MAVKKSKAFLESFHKIFSIGRVEKLLKPNMAIVYLFITLNLSESTTFSLSVVAS